MLYRSIQNIDIDKRRRIISSSRRCLPLSFYHVVSTLFVSFSSQTTERDELFTPLDSHHNNSLSALSVEIKGRQPRKLRERINRTETFDHCKNKTKFFLSLNLRSQFSSYLEVFSELRFWFCGLCSKSSRLASSFDHHVIVIKR